MSLQQSRYHQKEEPYWFSKAKQTFGSLIYDTRIEVLGIDTYRKISMSYDSSTGTLNKVLLDYYQKSFVEWRE